MKDRFNLNSDSDFYSEDYDDGFTASDRYTSKDYSREIYSDSSFLRYSDDNEDEDLDIYSDSSFKEQRSSRATLREERRNARAAEKKRRRRKRLILSLLSIFLIFSIVCTVAAFIFLERITSKVQYEPIDSLYSRENLFDSEVMLASSSSVKNILVLGVDQDSSDYGRSDSMILISIDKNGKKIGMTSFQRDTFVYIPDPDGGYRSKLTNAYSWGGVGLTIRTIEYNYGVEIDNYITVSFDTFKTIVDILGGIELELSDREILYINCQIAQNNQTEYLDAQAGKVKLNGQQALWHARNRGGSVINGVEFYEGSDWDRTQRQRDFMQALISEVKSTSIVKLLKIADGVSPYITTDIEKSELKKLILNCIRYRRYSVKECSMPAEDTWTYEDNFAGNVIYVNDWEQTRACLRNFIYE